MATAKAAHNSRLNPSDSAQPAPTPRGSPFDQLSVRALLGDGDVIDVLCMAGSLLRYALMK
jgi:hypothetical protein